MRQTAVGLMLLALVAGPVLAQPGAVEAEAAEAGRRFEAWIESTRAFIGGTTFNEPDLQSVLELWPEFAAIPDEEDEHEEMPDYETVLDDPGYRSFAAEHGVDAGAWLRKSARILTLVMRDQMTEHLAAAEAQLPQQLEAIEGQRAQYGEETYQTMKRTLEASATMMKRQRQAWDSMPEATASESALLEQYRDDLMDLMMAEEDEYEEEYEDDWDDG